MSASIYYEPVKGCRMNVDCPSTAISIIQQAFGSLPIEITHHDIEKLHGIAAANSDPIWSELRRAVSEHSTVRVWAEY